MDTQENLILLLSVGRRRWFDLKEKGEKLPWWAWLRRHEINVRMDVVGAYIISTVLRHPKALKELDTQKSEAKGPSILGTLQEKMQKYETVKRGGCQDCGNLWWWAMETGYVCTTCAKRHERIASDPYVPKIQRCEHKEKSTVNGVFYTCNECGKYPVQEGAK